MKEFRAVIILFCLGFAFRPAVALASGPDELIKLKADLTIGVEEGDENLIFGSVSQIDLDRDGRIYILDKKDKKVRIFEPGGKFLATISIPAGQGPAELTNINSMAVSPEGLVFLNEMRKVVVYDRQGTFIRSFSLDFNATSIGNAGDESVIALGLREEKILHVFDFAGRLIRSFGEPFDVPAALSEYKDNPILKAPFFFGASKSGRVFLLNPHAYEIRVYEKFNLIGVIHGKNEYFERASTPQQARGRAFLFPNGFIQGSGERTYVKIRKPMEKTGQELDVFEGGRQIGRLTVSGFPLAVDKEGRLYFAEEENYPRIVRYVVVK
ncbi:MAG: 6-bladed beta-propeller [Candidatus Aminicenantes bacterium]|nr:6-bladed beta-propeller [Candidatus Aminicenantes bacterium]